MSTTKHTSGPWTIDPEHPSCGVGPLVGPRIITATHDLIAELPTSEVCVFFGPAVDERDANARLIASAPDLLAALRGMVSDWERVHGPIPHDHDAKAAIARAEGGAP